MRKSIVLLASTTTIFAASTLYLLVERAGRTAAPAPVTAERIATSKPDRVASAPAASETFASTPEPADPLWLMGAENRQFLEHAADPELRRQLLEETKVNVRQRYPALDRLLGLDASGHDRL